MASKVGCCPHPAASHKGLGSSAICEDCAESSQPYWCWHSYDPSLAMKILDEIADGTEEWG